ncbi:unnamed protein product, partial [Owenia fusiformis]
MSDSITSDSSIQEDIPDNHQSARSENYLSSYYQESFESASTLSISSRFNSQQSDSSYSQGDFETGDETSLSIEDDFIQMKLKLLKKKAKTDDYHGIVSDMKNNGLQRAACENMSDIPEARDFIETKLTSLKQ